MKEESHDNGLRMEEDEGTKGGNFSMQRINTKLVKIYVNIDSKSGSMKYRL